MPGAVGILHLVRTAAATLVDVVPAIVGAGLLFFSPLAGVTAYGEITGGPLYYTHGHLVAGPGPPLHWYVDVPLLVADLVILLAVEAAYVTMSRLLAGRTLGRVLFRLA